MSERNTVRVVCLTLVTALYVGTMSRWIGAGDTALLLEQMYSGRFSSHVNSHNLAILLGWLAMKLPMANLAFKGHLVSVAAGVGLVMLFQEIAWKALRRPFATVVATMAAAVTHTFWWHATIVENYCLNGILIFGVTLLLLADDQREDRTCLWFAAVLAGLGMFNHMQMGILLPLGGVYALLKYGSSLREAAAVSGRLLVLWLAGAFPFLGLLIRDSGGGEHLSVATHNAMGAQFTAIMFDLQPSRLLPIIRHELFQQFPNVLVLLIPIGAVLALRSARWRVHAALVAAFLVNTGFFLTYHTWDRYAFLLPSVAILWVWGVEGWAWLLRRTDEGPPVRRYAAWAALSTTLWLPPWYHLQQVQWARDGGFGHDRFSGNTHWNTHDVGRYVAWPVKSEWDDMAEILTLLEDQLPGKAVWIDDDARTHYSFDFYWRSMNGRRPDIEQHIINAWGFDDWGLPAKSIGNRLPNWLRRGRRVFVVSTFSPHRDWQDQMARDQLLVPQRVDLSEDHWVFEMVPKPNGQASPTVLEVQTGLRLKSARALLTHRVGTDDRVAEIRIRHLREATPGRVRLRFTAEGHPDVEEVVDLDPDQARTVVPLPQAVQGLQGRWRVEVWDDKVALAHAWLKIEPGVPDRRWR